MTSVPPTPGALAPYRVLDLTTERGLLCGQILADLGADVIAVEPPGGSSARALRPFAGDRPDPNRSLFWWAFSRNKRSLTVDLDTTNGREQLGELVRSADFLIESFDPGYLDGIGIGYTALAARNPRLVMVSITPFGSTGPKASWAATDLTVWAASGVLTLTGDSDRPPVQVPGAQAWLHAGAEAAVGALIAHHARERDGRGQQVDVSAQAAAMMATVCQSLQAGWSDTPQARIAGGARAWGLDMRLIYPCKDGHVSIFFLFGSSAGPFTRRLLEWMYEEGFVDAATRDKDWLQYPGLLLSGQEPLSEFERCKAAVERFTRAHTKATLFAGALEHRLLITPVSTTADVVQSAQLTQRSYWTPVAQPDLDQPVTYPGPFAKLSATPIQYRRRPPTINEHQAELPRLWPAATGVRAPIAAASDAAVAAGTRRFALDGVKVLDFAWVMAGAMSARYFAEHGATVVHVESSSHVDGARTVGPFKDARPGPERSALYGNVNAGKLGLTLNLALPAARRIALRLAAWADVVLESYSPRAMRAWGLDYEAVRAVNPGVVMLSSCLNGQTGPWAGLAGFGTMGAQLAGFGELVGWPDRAPAGPFSAYTDTIAPRFTAAALLAALDHRARTGEGQYIDFAQAEAAIHFLTPALLDYTVNDRVQTRAGNASPDYAPHGIYPAAADDSWVAIACATEVHWQALCLATGHPEWQDDARFATVAARQAHRELLDQELGSWTAGRGVAAIEQLLQAAGVPVHRVSSSADAFADSQLAHREFWAWLDHPELGQIPVEGGRMRFSQTPGRIAWAAPTFGQHNQQVLQEIVGLSEEEIGELALGGALE